MNPQNRCIHIVSVTYFFDAIPELCGAFAVWMVDGRAVWMLR